MRLAIFGATGKAGRALLQRALDDGHEVRLLVRDPSRLAATNPGGLTIVEGDVRHREAVVATVAGADAVLSTLGGSGKRDPDVLRAGTASIVAAMGEAGVSRLVVLGGFHLPFAGDPGNLGRRLIVPLLRMTEHLVEDTTGMARLVTASALDWTIVRIPRLVRIAAAPRPEIGSLRLGPWSRVSPETAARFMLTCVAGDAYVRQAPMICDPRRARGRQTVKTILPEV